VQDLLSLIKPIISVSSAGARSGVKKKKKIFVQNQTGAFDSGKKMIPNLE
jgi:hypothetical protein